jgi:hypothetical protein
LSGNLDFSPKGQALSVSEILSHKEFSMRLVLLLLVASTGFASSYPVFENGTSLPSGGAAATEFGCGI